MSRTDAERLGDVLTALERCVRFRAHSESDDSTVSDMALDAILRNLAVAGEAVRALPDEVRTQFTSTSWHSIAGLRNIVIHEYFRIDNKIIFDVVDNHVGRLVDEIRSRLSGTGETEVAADE
ncbi:MULTISPECIES: HepT-like ribonuclease domain-containing protein [Prauserella salsuginis group]|uniref:DUF86 domain-containing protein n=1 Tax=Prauserella salsuginis TaxID=387889 RepID=A0ABW6G912_9PSEU|nr:HepT-like ribonuclease domain-containing protein [Prauserella flava]MCR3719432.1 putative conserved protein, contains HEPN domain [Prauserella flava]MCR3735554.1 putative conserved protein, contains HEPN domain [Prauserella salsuginis]